MNVLVEGWVVMDSMSWRLWYAVACAWLTSALRLTSRPAIQFHKPATARLHSPNCLARWLFIIAALGNPFLTASSVNSRRAPALSPRRVEIHRRYEAFYCAGLSLLLSFVYTFWPISFGRYWSAVNRANLCQALKLSPVGVFWPATLYKYLRQL